MTALRCASSSSITSTRFSSRSMKLRISPKVSSSTSFEIGFSTNATAPAFSAFWRPSPAETM
jgi:hypothetical protein